MAKILAYNEESILLPFPIEAAERPPASVNRRAAHPRNALSPKGFRRSPPPRRAHAGANTNMVKILPSNEERILLSFPNDAAERLPFRRIGRPHTPAMPYGQPFSADPRHRDEPMHQLARILL
jgi:hypothetical protein